MKHFHKLPYPHDYKSLRLFVRWFRIHQMYRYGTLNELSGKSPLKPPFKLSNNYLTDLYRDLLKSMVTMKPVSLT